MPMTKAFQMIATPDALNRMIAQIQDETCLALDTEFVWDRTYYARLGLLQIGLTDGTCFLIDAVALQDLAPIGGLLADARIVKILHDAPQDLMILRRATGVAARNVFDTRLAAGFAGFPSTISLGNLLSELVDVQLAKAHTRADWIARPLAPEVLGYAADDVRYLPQVATLLRSRARAAGVEAWLDEELAMFDEPTLSEEKALDDVYLRIRAAASLPRRNLAVLRELAAWREQAARAADLPRRWLLEDGELVAIAADMPRSPDGLRLKPQTVQRYGAELLAAVQRGCALPDSELPPPVFQPSRDPALRQAVDAALGDILTRATSRKIDPALVCSRSELTQLLQEGAAARPEAHALLRGWRAEFMGAALAAFMPKSLF
jgi:ribonuclease D